MSDIFTNRNGTPGAGFGFSPEDVENTDVVSGRQPSAQSASLGSLVWASPVFVVGCPRSGTTLVQTMLDSHPRLSVIYEANFLVDIPLGPRSCMASASEALALAEAHRAFRSDSFDVRIARAACADLGVTSAAGAMRVLAASHAFTQGKKRWGNKMPNALQHLAELAAVYPDAQFIHVIRDGRDSASSQARIGHLPSLVGGALLWRTGMRKGRRDGLSLGPGRYLELRFEELLSAPEEQVRRMCAFLGEDFDQSLLNSHTTARGRIAPSDLAHHPRLGEPPRPLLPSRDAAAATLAERAAAALIDAELVELGYLTAGSNGRCRRVAYMAIGYAFFLASLRRNWRDFIRHIVRHAGARRAARNARYHSRGQAPHLGCHATTTVAGLEHHTTGGES